MKQQKIHISTVILQMRNRFKQPVFLEEIRQIGIPQKNYEKNLHLFEAYLQGFQSEYKSTNNLHYNSKLFTTSTHCLAQYGGRTRSPPRTKFKIKTCSSLVPLSKTLQCCQHLYSFHRQQCIEREKPTL